MLRRPPSSSSSSWVTRPSYMDRGGFFSKLQAWGRISSWEFARERILSNLLLESLWSTRARRQPWHAPCKRTCLISSFTHTQELLSSLPQCPTNPLVVISILLNGNNVKPQDDQTFVYLNSICMMKCYGFFLSSHAMWSYAFNIVLPFARLVTIQHSEFIRVAQPTRIACVLLYSA